ncbi:MAG: hypothetical protein COX81_02340 [Candidatus Magasanikbacteria bacterium CG_4_10_14_0_2_um_filter_37_12]|uniref:Uncharacterized protein n=1 Tax=Candidatus Magasanikbacteria bacterium CG_4_10_14_0_2_um_filter_37_12 TaxID=1974637 RepID=A0A2M7V7V8_9BACT|nr:MAG: hypothetical protein COX81_02340 [Candidatus Magasanikbacteria bacterium CG_4_10_14_0_2_um_filter_37_12]
MEPIIKKTKETPETDLQEEEPNLPHPSKEVSQPLPTESIRNTEDFFEQSVITEIAPVPTTDRQTEYEPQVEDGIEKKGDGFLDETIEKLKKTLRLTKNKKNAQIPQIRDDITVKLEHIMEDGLADAYKELTPIQKQEFKMKGEETALKIRTLLSSARIKIKSIFQLILEWLKFLPGINRHFLEQEAKIKTDKIIALKEQMKKD